MSFTYRKTDHPKYRYVLTENYAHEVPFISFGRANRYVALSSRGRLNLKAGYAWDGPSGPSIDTEDFMRGSLVHDALYQLMREKVLSQAARKESDDLLYHICVKDGMPKWRAYYVWLAVRWFGQKAAKPSE